MSLGGNERRHNLIISLEFQAGDAVSRALRTGQDVRNALEQTLKQPLTFSDMLNSAQAVTAAERLGRQMREKIENELQIDIGQRTSGSVLSPKARSLVAATAIPGGDRTTATYLETLRAASAQIKQTAGGLERGSKTLSEADAKLATAEAKLLRGYAQEIDEEARLEQANRGLEGAKKRLATSVLAEAAAEEKAAIAATAVAKKQAENARADASAGTFRPEYSFPEAGTGLGAAQSGVNQALRRRLIAEEQHNALMARDDKTLIEVQQSEARLAAATTSLTAARRRVEIATIKAAPVPPARNFASQFGLGFKGETERPYAEQLGQAFKFSLFYGTAYKLLFALTQTFQQTLQEGIAFQQAVTELKLSTGRADDSVKALAGQLGQTAVASGLAPSEGVLIGARSLGLYGASRAPEAVQNRVAEESTQVVSRLALTSGQAAADLQTNIAAIVNAFGGGAGGQFRVADIDAYMAHRFGVAPGATIQAVSEAGTVGAAAGFNQEEVNAIAAALMARTGQTAPAVAGFMAQIFSRGGEGSLTGVAAKYGIDPSLELSKQIKELSQVYKTATPQQRAELSAAFGRGKVQNAAIALLQSFGEVENAAKAARGGAAAGAADKGFELRLSNIGGQIQLTTAVLKEFANQLGQSGLLTVLGAGVVLLRELVEAGTGLLKLWNLLPGTVKGTLASLGLLTLAMRLAAGRISGAALLGGTAATGGQLAGTTAGAAGLGRAGFGSAAASVGVAGGAIAAIIGAGVIKNAADRLDSAQASTSGVLNQGLAANSSAEVIRSRASELDEAAKTAQDAAHSFFGHVVDLGQASARDSALADQATTEAARLRKLAVLKEKQDAVDAAGTKAPLITGFDSESLTTSLDAITSSGGNAKDRLDALALSINASGDAAAAAAEGFNADLFAGTLAAPLQKHLADSPLYVGQTDVKGGRLGQFGELLHRTAFTPTSPGTITTNALPDALREKLSPEEISKRLREALGKEGVKSLADINPQMAEKLASDVLGTTPEEVLKGLGIEDPESINRVREGYGKIIKRSLLQQAKSVREIVKGTLALSPTELTASVGKLAADTQELLSGLAASDSSGRTQALRRQVRLIQRFIARTPTGATSQAQDALNAARIALSNQQIDDLENLRRAAQQNARSKREVASIGRGFLTRIIRNAVQNQNQDRLVSVIQTAGKYSIAIARTAINEAIAAAKAAVAMSREIQSFSNAALADAGIAMRAAAGGDKKRLDQYRKLRDVINHTMHGNRSTDNYFTGADANLPASLTDTPPVEDAGPTKAQIAAARQSAYAQGSESQISQARAAMATARADMAAAKKGTVEYYSALGAYLSARNELTDAIAAYRANLFLLHHDITNPLVQARADVRTAAAKLRSDAGKPADVRAADRVALQQAQNSQEATAFQQRLETVQTAEQLGRISHQRYIRYLENESHRLNQIKNRTYQQQQQLNQIDGLLQDASKEMEGQFNIAGIKLPTVYQVRRAIAERAGADGPGVRQIAPTRGSQVNSNNTTYIQIDGADYTKVKRLVTDEINKPSRVVTGAPRRRV